MLLTPPGAWGAGGALQKLCYVRITHSTEKRDVIYLSDSDTFMIDFLKVVQVCTCIYISPTLKRESLVQDDLP